MVVIGVGVDLVHVPSFGDQVDTPGTRFTQAFTPGERRDCTSEDGAVRVESLAARWAAKEAVIKAWSASLHGSPPVAPEQVHRLIEVVVDAWGRPRLALHGVVADHLDERDLHVSLSHDGEYATAYVVLDGR